MVSMSIVDGPTCRTVSRPFTLLRSLSTKVVQPMIASVRFALLRFAPVSLALLSFAPMSSAQMRFARVRCAR